MNQSFQFCYDLPMSNLYRCSNTIVINSFLYSQNGSSHGLLKPQYQASQEESIQQNDEMRNSANGGETRDKRLLLLSNPSVSASNKDNPTVSTTEEALPDSILKPSSKHAKATLAKPKLVSSIVENNPAYNSARYSEKIKIIKTDQNSNKTTG